MNSYIQILSLIFSFFYGIFFHLLVRFNKYILDKKNNIIKFIITLVFIIDIVILYIYLMYKINNGYFHIYFLFLLIIGYLLECFLFPKMLKKILYLFRKVKKM